MIEYDEKTDSAQLPPETRLKTLGTGKSLLAALTETNYTRLYCVNRKATTTHPGRLRCVCCKVRARLHCEAEITLQIVR